MSIRCLLARLCRSMVVEEEEVVEAVTMALVPDAGEEEEVGLEDS